MAKRNKNLPSKLKYRDSNGKRMIKFAISQQRIKYRMANKQKYLPFANKDTVFNGKTVLLYCCYLNNE